MEHYLLHWMHAYFVHFGIWMTLLGLMTFQREGLPIMWDQAWWKLKVIAGIAATMSIFSSHAQTHLLTHFLGQ